MSFLMGEFSKSSLSDSDSSRKSPLSSKHHDSIDNSDSTQSSYLSSTIRGQQNAEIKLSSKTKREVFRYNTNWLVSSIACAYNDGDHFELAVGSFIEEHCNRIDIVYLAKDSCDEEIILSNSFDHPYPPTKISWHPKVPDSADQPPRLLATSADCLRLWRIPEPTSSMLEGQTNGIFNNNTPECNPISRQSGEVRLECSLSTNGKASDRAPLTSFDWNEIDPRMIVTSSVDTTCTVWDVDVGGKISSTHQINNSMSIDKISHKLKNQIIAHDRAVYDVSFSKQGSGRDVFLTVGGDGSLRLFDLRVLTTSTVLYETSNGDQCQALVRVACNKQDANYLATFSTNSRDVLIIDVRKAGKPVAKLGSHGDSLNGISWAPHSAHHLCSASDDNQALIWGLQDLQDPTSDPILAYRANGKINAINWSASHPDWIAIGFENCLELLRV